MSLSDFDRFARKSVGSLIVLMRDKNASLLFLFFVFRSFFNSKSNDSKDSFLLHFMLSSISSCPISVAVASVVASGRLIFNVLYFSLDVGSNQTPLLLEYLTVSSNSLFLTPLHDSDWYDEYEEDDEEEDEEDDEEAESTEILLEAIGSTVI